jgi:proteasome-associated ATPase
MKPKYSGNPARLRYSNILSTLVPMFCSRWTDRFAPRHRHHPAEPRGPDRSAILRPGRSIGNWVNWPNREARDIYRIYLTDDLPYDGALASGQHRRASKN